MCVWSDSDGENERSRSDGVGRMPDDGGVHPTVLYSILYIATVNLSRCFKYATVIATA